MTDDRGRPISYLEWRSQQTGVPVEEIRNNFRQIGKKGGQASKGRTLTPEHKKKLSEAYWRRVKGE